jgi:hypothetical protein
MAQHLNGKTLKEHREAGMGLSPREADLSDSMLATSHSGGSRMQERLELTTVQMPPNPLFSMVMQPTLSSTIRTWPLQTLGVFDPNIHPLLFDIELNIGYKPWIFKPQEMTIQIDVAHDSSPFGKRVYHTLLPTENPEGPLVKGGEGGF